MNAAQFQAMNDFTQTSAAQMLLEYLYDVQEGFARAAIEEEVEELCGSYYKHDELHQARYQRWGSNPGSIRIGKQRIKIRVPRVRDHKINRERPLETYKAMHKPRPEQQDLISKTILLGIIQRNYAQTVKDCAASYGLSTLTISRIFQEYTTQVLAEEEKRDLSDDTYVTLMLDAVSMHGHHLILVIGITKMGEKMVLGFVEASTENADAVKGLLLNLLECGFRYDYEILCLIDGTEGLQTAIEDVFGIDAQVQCCDWHKRGDLLSPEK